MARRRGLRTGYTTGTCAAAAAKAAALALLEQRAREAVEVALPGGERVAFQVHRCQFGTPAAECSVVKDAGDDPDVTHGAEIGARIEWGQEPGVVLERGEGVGMVSKPGLGLPVGAPAITEVPRRMILASVREALNGRRRDLRVTISVADGQRLARKTLNQRLGIVGGLSILGTTGIVVPYSTAAYAACIAKALDVAVACGCRQVVLTTGSRSESFAQRMFALPEEAFVQMGDHVGHALRGCARRPLDRITIVGFVGKLSKMAAGHLQTHVRSSRVANGFLSAVAAECGASPNFISQASAANTARHFLDILRENQIEGVSERLCQLVCERMRDVVGADKAVECVMVDFDGHVLGRAARG